MANYTRFSPADWSSSNMSHYNGADNSRNNSERIRNEAVRLMRDRDEKTVLTQRDADRRLGERLHDVTFWRSELQVSFENIYWFHLIFIFVYISLNWKETWTRRIIWWRPVRIWNEVWRKRKDRCEWLPNVFIIEKVAKESIWSMIIQKTLWWEKWTLLSLVKTRWDKLSSR